jgi:bifunctional non-homologous end joining protein LigD
MPTLEKYRKKRDFEQTSEPKGTPRARKNGEVASAQSSLAYVVQKHAARRLHYDFRLELDGVLLSWAVPKGPSLDPGVKRLAVETEPHPLEYGDFEGTIPKGQYGGGTVMVWDRGSWTPKADAREGYAKGHLNFTLQGDKLKGAFHLVRTGQSTDEGKSWLLFKSKDEFAKPGEDDAILEQAPNSAASGRTLEQIAQAEDRQWSSNRGETKAAAAPEAKKKTSPKAKPKLEPSVPGAKRKKLDAAVEPELATLVDAAPEGDAYIHEVKFDGYRLLTHVDAGEVRLLTRTGQDWTERFPTLAARLARLGVESAVLDGEVVSLKEDGVSDFQALQNAIKLGSEAELHYYVFDLLHLDGFDLREVALLERKRLLAELLAARADELGERVRTSQHVVGDGPRFFAEACKLGLEGIISKRAASTYRSGRGRDWLKVKCTSRQEFVIAGYTEPGGARSHLGALLLAVQREEKLIYAGKVGTGFSEQSLRELHAALVPLETKRPRFEGAPRGAEARGVHWVEPKLVAEVAFTGFTEDGLLRHPSFQGLREDKPAQEVGLEAPVPTGRASAPARTSKSAKKPPANGYPLTNPDKVLYPEQGITKAELLDYYAAVADRMLPHVANRPLTLVRCPNGRDKPCFFQKHPGEGTPEGMRSIAIREKEGKAPYSVIDDALGLFGLVQLGALEIHTWGSRADDFEHADVLVFDLDPDPSIGFGPVIEAAKRLRELFDASKLESFVKTTGGKGLHVCVPIQPALEWDEVKAFTGEIAQALTREAPQKYLATVSKAQRKGKIFIDYLRNGRGATFIAPYSTRARENAPIAVPIEWDELTPKLDPLSFTVRTIEKRLTRLGRDPFERLATLRQPLPLP